MADLEDRSRSRFAQGTIHPDEVAAEAAAIRAALGPDDEVRAFAKSALKALNADLITAPDGDGFAVTTSTLPPGLRDAIGALIGERRRVPFSTTPAVPRGEASLARTDPVVGAVAGYVLANALDRHAPAGLRRPAAAVSSAPPLSSPGPRCCSSATATSSPCPDGTETRR